MKLDGVVVRMAFFFVVLLSAATGCFGTKVALDHYSPSISDDLNVYKGQRIYLMNFDNQAKNTSIWRYYSPDGKFGYSMNDTLHNYFWYSCHDLFMKLGMVVYSVDNADLTAPAIWLTLLSITDEQYRVRLTLQKRGVTEFVKIYSFQEPSLEAKDRTPEVLEQRAYRMTNGLIHSILKDEQFQKAIASP